MQCGYSSYEVCGQRLTMVASNSSDELASKGSARHLRTTFLVWIIISPSRQNLDLSRERCLPRHSRPGFVAQAGLSVLDNKAAAHPQILPPIVVLKCLMYNQNVRLEAFRAPHQIFSVRPLYPTHNSKRLRLRLPESTSPYSWCRNLVFKSKWRNNVHVKKHYQWLLLTV